MAVYKTLSEAIDAHLRQYHEAAGNEAAINTSYDGALEAQPTSSISMGEGSEVFRWGFGTWGIERITGKNLPEDV